MQGFGVNTYTLVNDEGKRHFVKFHMIPELGVHSLVWDEALKICGEDPGWPFFTCTYRILAKTLPFQIFTGRT